MSLVLHWGEEKFGLSDSVDVEALKHDIAVAVQAGGGWVEVNANRGASELFVSAGQYMRITTSVRGRVVV